MFISKLRYFPELQKLRLGKREKYTIVENRTFLFKDLDSVDHLEGIIGLAGKWRER
jgi:hypothetical protein